MRVAMVAPPPGHCGVGDYAAHLARALSQRVESVAVAPPGRFDPSVNDADIVHIQHEYFLFGGVAPWRAATAAYLRGVRRPIVMTAHEFVAPSGGLAMRMAIGASNRRHFGSPAIGRIIVHTQSDHDRMVEHLRLRPDQVVVVRHPVFDTAPLPERRASRVALDIEDQTVVTLLGFLSRRKGHRIALEAVPWFLPNMLLIIAGGKHPNDRTDYVAELTAAAQPAVDSHLARITGYLEEETMHRVLAATDIVVAPFLESSGSGSLARSYGCGLPVVASDIEPHREIVAKHPYAMALFRSGDPNDLARVVNEVAGDADLRAALADGSRAYADAHSMARMADDTIEVYRQVLTEAG